MARNFDLATGPNYVITSVGNVASVGNGAYTIIALFQTASGANTNNGLISFHAAGLNAQIIIDTAQVFGANDFEGGQTGVTTGTYRWVAIRKLTSGTSHYRYSLRAYNSGSTAHQTGTANYSDSGVSNTSVRLGDGDDKGNGLVAVWAAWTSSISDAAVEACFTTAAADVLAQSPNALWLGNQASGATPIPDSTGGGANETSTNGTVNTGTDPAGYNYSLTAAAGAASVVLPPYLLLRLVLESQRNTSNSGTNAVTISGVASLTGAGSLSTVSTQGAIDSVTGAGSATAAVRLAAPDTVTGAGSVTNSATTGSSGNVIGAGTLNPLVTQGAKDTPTGAGTLSDTAVESVTATPTGVGSVTDAATEQATAAPTGAGTVTDAVTLSCTVSMTGAGTVNAGAGQTAGLAGAGSVSALATVISAATPVGAGTLAALATAAGNAALTELGTLTTAICQLATVSATGTGSLTAFVGGLTSGTATLIGAGVLTADTQSCVVYRPSTGLTTRPGTGTTAYATATTPRPGTGTTGRPNTGETEQPWRGGPVSRDTVLARGRLFFTPGLIDACVIDRVNGESTNPTIGLVTKTYATIYTGACRVKMGAAQPTRRLRQVGEAALRIAAVELQLPVVGSEGVFADDRVTITACLHDTELVGLVFYVQGEHHATHATSRRLSLGEVLKLMGVTVRGIDEWLAILESLPERANERFSRIMGQGGLNIKKDWTARWHAMPHAHIPHLIRLVNYEVTDRDFVYSVEVGIKPGEQARLASFIEYGTLTSRPHPAGMPALEAEAPRTAEYAEKAAADLLEGKK